MSHKAVQCFFDLKFVFWPCMYDCMDESQGSAVLVCPELIFWPCAQASTPSLSMSS